jgi:phage terminase small subunit
MGEVQQATKKTARGLTAKQRLFVTAYLQDCNAAKAYRKAYADSTIASANTNGPRLLRNARVAEAVATGMEKREEKDWLKIEDLERALSRIVNFDPAQMVDESGNALPLNKVPEEARLAVAGIDSEELWEGRGRDAVQTGVVRKWKAFDKVSAIALGMKRRGLLIDKHELLGPAHVVVNIGVRHKAPAKGAA